MQRKIFIGLALLVAILQFPGFPQDIVRWVSLTAALLIVFLLTVYKNGKITTPGGMLSDDATIERKVTIIRRVRGVEADASFGDKV